MGLFRRNVTASVSPCAPAALAVGGNGLVSANVGFGRARAMALPTIKRARDINASLIGSLPIRRFGTQWNGEYLEEIPLPPEPWQFRPDPKTTRAHTLSWTFDDMLFYGVAYWRVTRRYKEQIEKSNQKIDALDLKIDRLMRHRPMGWYGVLGFARYREEHYTESNQVLQSLS